MSATRIDNLVQWRAPGLDYSHRPLEALEGVLIHRSITPDPSPEGLASLFLDEMGWSCVPYTFYCWGGVLYQMAPLAAHTPHAGHLNPRWASVAIHGDERPGGGPRFALLDALSAQTIVGLLAWIFDWSANSIEGHSNKVTSKQWPDKECPGSLFNLSMFRLSAAKQAGTHPKSILTYPERFEYARSCGLRINT